MINGIIVPMSADAYPRVTAEVLDAYVCVQIVKLWILLGDS